MSKKPYVDVIIPTYKPAEKFDLLIQRLSEQTYEIHEILVINTEEQYMNSEKYERFPKLRIVHIKKEQFDHGGTRAMAAKLSGAEIMVFMTDDAVPADEFLIERLIAPFEDDEVGLAYARQISDGTADILEEYTRNFNYPEKSRIKSIRDINEMGIKTFFCSNACAAYRKDLYSSLGGFVKRTIFNEDMIYASKVIYSGKSIAYVAEAEVIHTHHYSCFRLFSRNFDLGVSQTDHPEVFEAVSSEEEGIKLVRKTAGYLIKSRKPHLIFRLIWESGFKFLGYQFGRHYKGLPIWMIKKMSMNKEYWKGNANNVE